MCGRLVNLDTVARVLAEYYHLKTETQLAALDEALSKVPAVSVGGGHKKDHVADPGKMVGDLISRQAAIDALAEWHDPAITNRLNNLPSVDAVPVKHSEWIPKEKADTPYGLEMECAKCGFSVIVNDALYFKFCPYCGAKVDEKDGDDGTAEKTEKKV